jgi:general secretion pathway protein C
MRHVTVRHAVLAFLLIPSCFFLADVVNVYISHALLQITPLDPSTNQAADSSFAQVPSPDSTQMVKAILSSGLFVVPANVSALDPDARQHDTPPPQPLEFAGKLKLLGTALGNGVKTYAAVEFDADKKQRLYALYEEIEAFGQVIEIRRDAIRIRQGEREGEVPLFMPIPSPMPVVPVTAPTVSKDSRVVVDRRMLLGSFGDLPKLMNEAKAVPYYDGGKVLGWHLLSFLPDSVFSRLGLIPGDILLRANGAKMDDPTRLLAFFQEAKSERTIKLEIIREFEPVKITYDIR